MFDEIVWSLSEYGKVQVKKDNKEAKTLDFLENFILCS